jgi:hypothetical protein
MAGLPRRPMAMNSPSSDRASVLTGAVAVASGGAAVIGKTLASEAARRRSTVLVGDVAGHAPGHVPMIDGGIRRDLHVVR